jgi:hypothetical protein
MAGTSLAAPMGSRCGAEFNFPCAVDCPSPPVRRFPQERQRTGKEMQMVTRNELFPSRFLNADNVERPIVATIAFAKMETLKNTKGESDEKLVVFFSDNKQNLALNGVNFDSIVDISGEDDSDRWSGTRIEIYRTTTEVAGKATPCIRVREPQSKDEMKDEMRF